MLEQPTVTVFGKMVNMKFGATPKGVAMLNFGVGAVNKDGVKYFVDCTVFGTRVESLRWLSGVNGTIVCYASGPLNITLYKDQPKASMYCNDLKVFVVDNDRKFTATNTEPEALDEPEQNDDEPPF